MSRKLKILIPVLAAVVLLTVGGVATVMAQESPTQPTSPPPATGPKALLARVAQILGIPEETLVSAFKQAGQEMREEAFVRRLDKAVEKGRLTQDEANAIKEWWQQRPEAIGPGAFPGAFGAPPFHGKNMMRGGMMGGHRGWCSDNSTQPG